MESLQNSCLQKTCNIVWPSKISNRDLHEETGCCSVVMEIIKKQSMRWLHHIFILCCGNAYHIKPATVRWTPLKGKRKPERPKTIWQTYIIHEYYIYTCIVFNLFVFFVHVLLTTSPYSIRRGLDGLREVVRKNVTGVKPQLNAQV